MTPYERFNIAISERDDQVERERVVISELGTVLAHTLEQGDKSRDFRVFQPHSVTLVI